MLVTKFGRNSTIVSACLGPPSEKTEGNKKNNTLKIKM